MIFLVYTLYRWELMRKKFVHVDNTAHQLLMTVDDNTMLDANSGHLVNWQFSTLFWTGLVWFCTLFVCFKCRNSIWARVRASTYSVIVLVAWPSKIRVLGPGIDLPVVSFHGTGHEGEHFFKAPLFMTVGLHGLHSSYLVPSPSTFQQNFGGIQHKPWPAIS